jgi:hypothetical protein
VIFAGGDKDKWERPEGPLASGHVRGQSPPPPPHAVELTWRCVACGYLLAAENARMNVIQKLCRLTYSMLLDF